MGNIVIVLFKEIFGVLPFFGFSYFTIDLEGIRFNKTVLRKVNFNELSWIFFVFKEISK